MAAPRLAAGRIGDVAAVACGGLADATGAVVGAHGKAVIEKIFLDTLNCLHWSIITWTVVTFPVLPSNSDLGLSAQSAHRIPPIFYS